MEHTDHFLGAVFCLQAQGGSSADKFQRSRHGQPAHFHSSGPPMKCLISGKLHNGIMSKNNFPSLGLFKKPKIWGKGGSVHSVTSLALIPPQNNGLETKANLCWGLRSQAGSCTSVLSHFIPTATLWGRYCYYSHLQGEDKVKKFAHLVRSTVKKWTQVSEP